MALRLITILLLSFTLHSTAYASDFDIEDVSAESDGAMAQTKDVKAQMMNQKNEADQAHKTAVKRRDSAAAKRQEAINRLKESEAEIQTLGAEEGKLKAEVEQMKIETAAAEKSAQENKLKAEKAKAEMQTLQDLKTELTGKIAALNTQRDKAILEIRDMEESKALDTHAFQKLKEGEREAREALEKTKLEAAQKRAELDGKPVKAAATATADGKPGGMGVPGAAVPAVPVATAATAPAPAKPSVALANAGSDVEMTFKRDCKIFDRPTKEPKILGMKLSGSTVHKSEEGKGWIAFPLSTGQKGYVAKNCF